MKSQKLRTSEGQRDREATKRRILDAAAETLAQEGFATFGVNSVARAAGCDKVLIYRYFGGLEGLLEQLGARLDLWVSVVEIPAKTTGYGVVMAAVLRDYIAVLRRSALVKRILVWELSEDNAATAALGAAKSKAVQTWFSGVRKLSGEPPKGVDAAAVNAILLAAVHHLALREDSGGNFAGINLRDAHNWERLTGAMEFILERVYATSRKEN